MQQFAYTSGKNATDSGRWLVNGSPDGLVEPTIEPPCYTGRKPVSLFAVRDTVSLEPAAAYRLEAGLEAGAGVQPVEQVADPALHGARMGA